MKKQSETSTGEGRKQALPWLSRVSLRLLFSILFFVLMTGTILLGFLINTIFLERYYVADRKNTLVGVYKGLLEASQQDLLDEDEFDMELQKSLSRSNVSLMIVDSNTTTGLFSFNAFTTSSFTLMFIAISSPLYSGMRSLL